jgi:hypothetical protein
MDDDYNLHLKRFDDGFCERSQIKLTNVAVSDVSTVKYN